MPLHSDDGILFDGFLEKKFVWGREPGGFRISENKSYGRRKIFGGVLLADAIPDDESVQPFFADLRGERQTFVKRLWCK